MTGKRQIEARWGVEFWRLVADFADQGLCRSDVGKALGYSRDGFYYVLSQNPQYDPFESYTIAVNYLRDTGEGFKAALERMASEGRSWGYAARAIGYCDGSRLKRAAEARGISVQMNSRHTGRPRIRPAPTPRNINITAGWPTWEQVYAMGRKECTSQQKNT